MAAKLCCTAEQEDRPDSPGLPNARVSEATPAKRPLLPKQTGSPSSRFTSARSEDLHELQDIFDNAQDRLDDRASPKRAPHPRFSRPSMHSLRSLHRMTSMRSIIRRKFSKDLPSPVRSKAKNKTISEEPGTVVKQLAEVPNQQLKITKDDLRKDLLSDKKPDEGGYDLDAEVLDDIARNVGKKAPSKRPSIHSIDWTPSTGSKPTPGSSTKDGSSTEIKRNLQPYHIQKPQTVSLSNRFSQVFSTPNLRSDTSGERDRRLRRSHSATSMGLPKPSPISPLRLPSLTAQDKDGVPWSEVMNESLRLSQFPVPPRQTSLEASKTMPDIAHNPEDGGSNSRAWRSAVTLSSHRAPDTFATPSARAIEIRVQQPTSITSPRTSTSVRGVFRDNALPDRKSQDKEARDDDGEDNPRRSVHLYSMRISHHLRSGSLLSWDQLVDVPELPTPPRPFRERTVSDQSRYSQVQRQLARHERQTSSSGFASSKVPSRWGTVLSNNCDLRPDVASSIYSSRPQSPPDSFGGSMVSLSRAGSGQHPSRIPSIDFKKLRRSNSFPTTENENTPKPAQRYGVTNLAAAQGSTAESSLLATPTALARKNSVAETKRSKFREEFSPSPPKKKLTPSSSIIKFLNPKRLSMRSQSEANFQPDSLGMAMDGLYDTLPIPADRERRQSRSMMSLQTEQEALGQDKGANHVWDRALKAHQEEKASLFLPKNRDLAVYASPFRERSGSISARHNSVDEDKDPASQPANAAKQLSAYSTSPSEQGSELPPALISRRSALAGRDDVNPGHEVSTAFEKQGDGTEVVGAWGRYPSHTRHDRTFSAGKVDLVETRDFALEAAIKFASTRDDTHDGDLVDPTERIPSPPLLTGEKKRKKKVGSGRMAKSNSMTFGKTFIKNYSKIFRSQSTEFRRHGRGHRSSIASGGILEFPELELVPDVWAGGDPEQGSADGHNNGDSHTAQHPNHRNTDAKDKGKLQVGNSMATLRPRRNSSAPNLNDMSLFDGAGDTEHTQDRARVWSVYYENCVSPFPRQSTEANLGLEDFGGPARRSFDSKRVSLHSRTMPVRLTKHSRNASQLSRMSNLSRGSARPSFFFIGDDDGASEEKSLVSVRRSTMDLISKFREQEATEHEKVLALTRAESQRGIEAIATL